MLCCGGGTCGGVKWPWVSGLNGLQLINSVRGGSLPLPPLPAGDPSRRGCVQEEAESPDGGRYAGVSLLRAGPSLSGPRSNVLLL